MSAGGRSAPERGLLRLAVLWAGSFPPPPDRPAAQVLLLPTTAQLQNMSFFSSPVRPSSCPAAMDGGYRLCKIRCKCARCIRLLWIQSHRQHKPTLALHAVEQRMDSRFVSRTTAVTTAVVVVIVVMRLSWPELAGSGTAAGGTDREQIIVRGRAGVGVEARTRHMRSGARATSTPVRVLAPASWLGLACMLGWRSG